MDIETMSLVEEIEEEEKVLLDHPEGEEDEDEDKDVALPGFRFHPTDEELLGFYLQRKVEKKRLRIDIIKQVDVYKFDPWDLAKQSTLGAGENEWYFFCLRERKYRNSIRPNRVTKSGYWKATGIDKKVIFPRGTNNCIGLKKSLVYYSGKGGKGTKTYWMMHEFRLPPKGTEISNNARTISADEAENWTICRIFPRNPSSPKKSPSKSTPIPTEERKLISCVEESSDFGVQILEELLATSVAPPGEDALLVDDPNSQQEQVLSQCADEENCSSSSFFDEILSENPHSSFGFPDTFDDFGSTNWEELGRFV